MRTSVQIFLVVVLVLSVRLSTNAKAKLLVTKEVLIEYVEDRLSQLEGKEELDEEEAVELDFIRENRHNLRALADFYRMKIKEEIPETIAAVPPSGVETSRRAFLKLESKPAGAQVFVDGGFKGKTPLHFELPLGKHEFRLTLPDHYDWEARVELTEEGETPLLIQMLLIEEERQ